MPNKSKSLFLARAQKAKFAMIELELVHGEAAKELAEYQKAEAKFSAAMAELNASKLSA